MYLIHFAFRINIISNKIPIFFDRMSRLIFCIFSIAILAFVNSQHMNAIRTIWIQTPVDECGQESGNRKNIHRYSVSAPLTA